MELNRKEEEFEKKIKKKVMSERLSSDGLKETERHNQEKEAIRNQIEENLNARKIMCYHCTRLTKNDYYSIKKNGLMALTKEKQLERIKKIGLDKEEAQIISNLKSKDISNREGKIYFVYSLETIDTGCIPFFEYWGGESIYDNINEMKKLKDKTIRMSRPYVVKFTVKYKDIYVNTIIDNMKNKLKNGMIDGEGCIKKDVPSENIIDIILADDILHNLKL